MRELTPFEQMLADQCAARHRIPKSTVNHPQGVIVPNDPFMTAKLRDPDYVPYCGPCSLMQRVRRVTDGFECPACGNKSNYDLTRYNGNINVQYESATPSQEATEQTPCPVCAPDIDPHCPLCDGQGTAPVWCKTAVAPAPPEDKP